MAPRPTARIRARPIKPKKKIRPAKPKEGEFILNVPTRGKTKTLNEKAIQRMMPNLLNTLAEWARTLPIRTGARGYIVVRRRSGLIVPDVQRVKVFPVRQGLRVIVPKDLHILTRVFDTFANHSKQVEFQRKRVRAWHAGERLAHMLNGRSLTGLFLKRGKKPHAARAVRDMRVYLDKAPVFTRDPELFALLLSRVRNQTAAQYILREYAHHMSKPNARRAEALLNRYQRNPPGEPQKSPPVEHFLRARRTYEGGVVAYDYFPSPPQEKILF